MFSFHHGYIIFDRQQRTDAKFIEFHYLMNLGTTRRFAVALMAADEEVTQT
jgi:hypothetical protein